MVCAPVSRAPMWRQSDATDTIRPVIVAHGGIPPYLTRSPAMTTIPVLQTPEASASITGRTFQDQIPDNFCYGCGPGNLVGLRIRSIWAGNEALCIFQPAPYHAAGPRHILNGGIIATLIDCHAVGTAIAHAYCAERRAIGSRSEERRVGNECRSRGAQDHEKKTNDTYGR